MRKSDEILHEIAVAEAELSDLKVAYKNALTAQSWKTQDGTSSREVKNANVSALARLIREKEEQIANLKAKLNGLSRYVVKVGVAR